MSPDVRQFHKLKYIDPRHNLNGNSFGVASRYKGTDEKILDVAGAGL